MKNYTIFFGVLVIATLSFFVGRISYNIPLSPAGLSVPFLSNTAQSVRTCTNQKCVEVSSQCSTDNECKTHMECNNLKQCISVSGAGTNQCSVNNDCIPIKDPQKWCEAKNPGLNSVATKYPNGNFSCLCYSTKNITTRAQMNCIDAHLNQ